MANFPGYASLALLAQGQVTAANTNRDGSGSNLVQVLVGASPGYVISLVRIVAVSTTTAGMVRMFTDLSGTKRLFRERRVTPITPSATVKVFEDEFRITDLTLPDSTWSLYFGTHNAETFNIFVMGGKLG